MGLKRTERASTAPFVFSTGAVRHSQHIRPRDDLDEFLSYAHHLRSTASMLVAQSMSCHAHRTSSSPLQHHPEQHRHFPPL